MSPDLGMSLAGYVATRVPGQDPVKVNRAPARRTRWKRVEQARTLIEASSKDIAKSLVKQAIAGDRKAAQWLLEHTAASRPDGEETRPLAPGIDKQGFSGAGGSHGPQVFIGVPLGSDFARLNANQTPSSPALLPAASQSVSVRTVPIDNAPVIDVEPVRVSQGGSE